MTNQNKGLYKFGPFRLNVAERRLFREGTEIPISPKAFDLLLLLVRDAGHLKSREELIEALWPKTIVGEHNLTSNLYQLRKALGDEGAVPRYIQTVWRHGYRFVAPVATDGDPDNAIAAAADPQPDGGAGQKRRRRIGIAAFILAVLLIAAGLTAWRVIPRAPADEATHARVPVIAVLPFANLSADRAGTAYLTDGIQDTILTRLAGIDGFRVVSRTSTESYASRPGNLKRVARQLGATTLLEGSVQKAGVRVQINVQLIDARTDTHIWAATFTRPLNDIFEVEGDVAARVASALQTKLLPADVARLNQPSTRDPQAYLLFLKANHYANETFDQVNVKDPAAAVAEAISLYRRALDRDPDFALAWARLSLLESHAYWFEIDPTPERSAAAEKSAKQALALDPDLPQARLAMGYVEYYCHRNYPAALRQFEQAAVGLPHNATVVGAIAYIHRRQGKWPEALAGLTRAAEFDPRNPRWPDEIGETLMTLRRYGEALQRFDQALAIAPDDYDAATRRIAVLFLTGKLAQARREIATISRGTDPQGLTSTLRFEAAFLARKPDQALAVLAGAPAWMQGGNTLGASPKSLFQAAAWTLKGDPARARRAYEDARDKLLATLRTQSDNPDPWAALGLAEAGLGERGSAIRAGKHATELFPMSKDILLGPLYLAVLAKIHARLGESAPAVKLLARLLAMPAGRFVSVPLLRLNPIWDPIRQKTDFQALLKRYENNPPLPATVAVNTGN